MTSRGNRNHLIWLISQFHVNYFIFNEFCWIMCIFKAFKGAWQLSTLFKIGGNCALVYIGLRSMSYKWHHEAKIISLYVCVCLCLYVSVCVCVSVGKAGSCRETGRCDCFLILTIDLFANWLPGAYHLSALENRKLLSLSKNIIVIYNWICNLHCPLRVELTS